MIRRLSDQGANYKPEEVDKIFRFFKDKNLIEYYMLWEKIFKIYVLSNNEKYFKETFNNIKNLINENIEIGADICNGDKNQTENKLKLLKIVKTTLSKNLDYASTLSLCYINKININFYNKIISFFEFNNKCNYKEIIRKFEKTFFARRNYNNYPLLEFISEIVIKKNGIQQIKYKEIKNNFIPYYIPFFEVYLKNLIELRQINNILNKTYDEYSILNKKVSNNIKKPFEININKKRPIQEIHIKGNTNKNTKLILGLVEEYINDSDIENLLKDGYSNINHFITKSEIENTNIMLDQISKINGCDIFIMPEMSINAQSLLNLCKYSKQKQIAFIGGMKYLIKDKYVYNNIITCLPIKMENGIKDVIPIVRLKNYYSPKERELIEKYQLKVPKDKKIYHLLKWRNHYFTNFYCFELTNIKDRALFLGKVDAIYIPVYNKDTFYFNNIINSMTRDLHCYIIQVNVSQYGDTRITQPTKNEKMDKLKIKGGTNSKNQLVVLVGDIDISKLREFQKLSIFGQINDKTFKPLPPEYVIDFVKNRTEEEK